MSRGNRVSCTFDNYMPLENVNNLDPFCKNCPSLRFSKLFYMSVLIRKKKKTSMLGV